MQHKLSTLLTPILLTGLAACTAAPHHDAPGRDDDVYYRDRDGYSDYDYYYYPGTSVYFQIHTGYYYYQDHGRWLRARQLPPSIHLDPGYRRHMIIHDAQPYQHHDEHEREYGTHAGGGPKGDRPDHPRDRDGDDHQGGRGGPERASPPANRYLPDQGRRDDHGQPGAGGASDGRYTPHAPATPGPRPWSAPQPQGPAPGTPPRQSHDDKRETPANPGNAGRDRHDGPPPARNTGRQGGQDGDKPNPPNTGQARPSDGPPPRNTPSSGRYPGDAEERGKGSGN